MSFPALLSRARNKENFVSLDDYVSFAIVFLSKCDSFIEAKIICQNETDYRFWQLPAETAHSISRPLNSVLLCSPDELESFEAHVLGGLGSRPFMESLTPADRFLITRVIYTVQQMIGVTLDGLPSNASNFARKLNGDLFERLIQLWIRAMGIECLSACIRVPVMVDGVKQSDMNFQHDLVIRSNGAVKIIGSVKTSSKDRIGKIFVDKMLLRALTDHNTPHIAIFLNDVQRGKKDQRTYRVSSTFLPGHFKGYTIKLNPLDGVYYCDIRPNMRSDPFLSDRIQTIDNLFCEDIWRLVDEVSDIPIKVQDDEGLS